MAAARRNSRHLWLALAFAPLALPASLPASAGSSLIYVTNSAGDSIHAIDPATNKVVQEIKGIEAAHGIAPSPDGTRVYVSNESDSTLDVFDRASGSLIKKVPLSNHPNNIAVTKNGDRVLVGIARGAGAVDVIDTKTLTRTKSILVKGRLHNIYVTPDGKYLITGSIPNKLRKWPKKARPALSAYDARMMRRYGPGGSKQKSIKKLATDAGFSCKKR